jgi:hypothetical protein
MRQRVALAKILKQMDVQGQEKMRVLPIDHCGPSFKSNSCLLKTSP